MGAKAVVRIDAPPGKRRPEDILEMRRQMRAAPQDLILGTDPASDAPIIFDEHGRRVPGDEAGILVAQWLKAETVVAPVCCSSWVLRAGFNRVYHGQVPADAHLPSYIGWERDRGAAGYRLDGAFLTAGPIERNGRTLHPLPAPDPTIVHLALMCRTSETGTPIGKMAEAACCRHTAHGSLGETPEGKQLVLQLRQRSAGGFSELNSLFGKHFGELQEIAMNLPGLRMRFRSGLIIHLHFSAVSDELSCHVEADTASNAEECLTRVLRMIEGWKLQGL